MSEDLDILEGASENLLRFYIAHWRSKAFRLQKELVLSKQLQFETKLHIQEMQEEMDVLRQEKIELLDKVKSLKNKRK